MIKSAIVESHSNIKFLRLFNMWLYSCRKKKKNVSSLPGLYGPHMGRNSSQQMNRRPPWAQRISWRGQSPKSKKMQTWGRGDIYCCCNPALVSQPHKPNAAGEGGRWTESVSVKNSSTKRLNHKNHEKIYYSFHIYTATVSSFWSLFGLTTGKSNSRSHFHGN